MPTFTLPSVDGRRYSSLDFKGRPTVILFICAHCPYVQAIEQRLIDLAKAYADKVHFVGICSNDASDYPEDAPAALLERWREKNYGFPYLTDEEQTTAKDFGAVCTPDIYVYDSDQKLKYRGRLDDSWRNPQNVCRHELREALEALLANKPIFEPQNPSMGCSIKWKKG